MTRSSQTLRPLALPAAWFGLFLLSAVSFVMVVREGQIVRWSDSPSEGVTYLGRAGVEMQSGNNDCGPAALKMVLDRFGINTTTNGLKHHLQLSRRGTAMLGLRKLARTMGLACEGWTLTPEDLRTCPIPLILFIRGNHFIAVDSVNSSREVFVRDPAVGRISLSLERLASVWRGEALVFNLPAQKNN